MNKLLPYIGSFGSCSGCDWLSSVIVEDDEIPYKEALDYCGGIKPSYIVPKDRPLKFENKGNYEGWGLLP